MVLYAKMVRWEVWNNYDWYHSNSASEPVHTSLWYHEDEPLPDPPEVKSYQVLRKGIKFVKV